MFTYKAEIKSGPLLEVKYYKSIRKRNKEKSCSTNQSIQNKRKASQSKPYQRRTTHTEAYPLQLL